MSGKKIHFKIVSPEKIIYDNDVDAVYAQGVSGSFGILPDHIPFMSVLKIGIAKVQSEGKEQLFSVMGGALQFKNNEAVILTETAEPGGDIDTARAQLAKERAEALLGASQQPADIKAAENKLARALARLKAAGKIQ